MIPRRASRHTFNLFSIMVRSAAITRARSLSLFPGLFPGLTLALLLLAAAPALGFDLDLPLDCAHTGLVQGCVIQNYVDQDPGPQCRDYACGQLCYEDHNGTDFRVTKQAMEQGVVVRAAADGVVVALRDEMPDTPFRDLPPGAIDNRDAGNGVRINHGNGWISQYSHLKKGSILVHKGQHVVRGQPLGQVGLSGRSDFPHVELLVEYQGQRVDPFTGPQTDVHQGCGPGLHVLWTDAALAALAYPGAGLVEHGFDNALPDMDALYDWGPQRATLAKDSKILLYWSVLYGVRAGDRFSLTILGPDGKVFAQNQHVLDKTQPQRIEYLGRKLSQGTWPSGTYQGRCLLERGQGGQARVLVDQTATVDLR